MPASSYLDVSLARLCSDWLSNARWTEALSDLIRSFLDEYRSAPCVRYKFSSDGEEAESQKSALREGLAGIASVERENPAIVSLADRFSLSSTEVGLLEFLYMYLSFPSLEAYVDKLPEWDALGRMARYCGSDESRLYETMGHASTMVSSGLCSTDGPVLRLVKRGIAIGLPDQIVSFIACEGRQPLVSFILQADSGPRLPLSAFALSDTTIAAARATLSSAKGKPCLLVYGKPGTGKTEFAKTISTVCGYVPCFLRHDRDRGTRSYSDLLLAARLIDPAREVLVVDEADEFLNLEATASKSQGLFKEGVKKGMVNEFLDGTGARMIFISNETWRIPDSILRRFSFHLGFDDFSLMQRTRVWNELDEGFALFNDKDRSALAARYKANPSRIRQVFDVCSSVKADDGADDGLVVRIAEEMLSRGDELLYGVARKERRESVSYDPEFLNLGTPAAEIMNGLELWKATFERSRRGINLLFYGAPGTGKTAFASHLAESLGYQAVIRRYSDLASAWVGETEKRIRAAFRDAEGAVLILDEVDSILASREDARNSWERTQTNEVLTCMEDFKGIFIASTNLRAMLDVASLRRFAFKVEFRPTAPDRRRRLVESYFPDLSMSEEGWSELESLGSLTPGDVAIAATRLRFSPRGDGLKVLAALREEASSHESRQARIGF